MPNKEEDFWTGPRGLDLADADETTVEEWEAWKAHETLSRGYPLPTYQLLGEAGRPDAVKRWMRQIRQFEEDDSYSDPGMVFMHLYLIWGFEAGIGYELSNCHVRGHTKADISDCIALAHMHSPAEGMHGVYEFVADKLRNYVPGDATPVYPDGWEFDPEAFRSGIDFSNPKMSKAELKLVEKWYLDVTGEIPRHVSLLAEFRPDLLKGYRDRFEHVFKSLPKQMLPFIALHWETTCRSEEGIRDSLLLAKGFGISKTHAFDAIAWGMLYGGPTVLSVVDRAGGDILRDW